MINAATEDGIYMLGNHRSSTTIGPTSSHNTLSKGYLTFGGVYPERHILHTSQMVRIHVLTEIGLLMRTHVQVDANQEVRIQKLYRE